MFRLTESSSISEPFWWAVPCVVAQSRGIKPCSKYINVLEDCSQHAHHPPIHPHHGKVQWTYRAPKKDRALVQWHHMKFLHPSNLFILQIFHHVSCLLSDTPVSYALNSVRFLPCTHILHCHSKCNGMPNWQLARLHCSHNSELRFVSVLSCVFVFIHERCTSSCCVRLSLANCSQTRWNWLSYNITLFHDVCTHSMKWGGNERIDFSYSAVFVYQYQQRIRLLMWQTFQSLCVFGEGRESFPTLCSGVAKYFEKRNAIYGDFS